MFNPTELKPPTARDILWTFIFPWMFSW